MKPLQRGLPLEYVPLVAAGCDAVIFALAAFWAQAAVYGFGFYVVELEAWIGLVTAVSAVGVVAYSEGYRVRTLVKPLRSLPKFLFIVAAIYSFSYFFFKDVITGPTSGFLPWLELNAVFGVGSFVVWRVVLGLLFNTVQSSGIVQRRIAILGAGDQACRLLDLHQSHKTSFNHIVGLYDDRKSRLDPEYRGQPVIGTSDDLVDAVRRNEIDEVIVALPWSADARLQAIIARLKELPVGLRILSDVAGFNYMGRTVTDELFIGLPMLNAASKPMAGWRRPLKSLEDRVLGLFAMLFAAPVMLVVALAIKLESKGPILFRQERYGFNNQIFHVYKFRSMYHADDPRRGKDQATRKDPRVTKVGWFIRRTSLDELPQLFNVLEGTMSLVGPRPHSVDHNEQYSKEIQGYFSRHKVKPGITGWAQVNGLRGETDKLAKMEYRVLYDVHYIENWSLMFDLEILALTVIYGVVGKNAY